MKHNILITENVNGREILKIHASNIADALISFSDYLKQSVTIERYRQASIVEVNISIANS